jgi:hypothetical protein
MQLCFSPNRPFAVYRTANENLLFNIREIVVGNFFFEPASRQM